MAVFKDFFEAGKFVKSLNSTFMVMIPKMKGLKTLRILDLLAWRVAFFTS